LIETWLKVIVLSVGGTLGVNARYWQGVWMSRWTSPQFPWATVSINVTGSFLIGLLTVALTRWLPHPNMRLLILTGFLGGYTTFSTFENDTLTLWERGEGMLAAANVIGSVAIGLAAVILGTALGRGLTK
jgi:fluoride exporter